MTKQRTRLTDIRRPASGINIDKKQLMRLRNGKAWSREELAERSGVSTATIMAWENGKRRPTTVTLAALCEALGCQPADLLAPL